MGLHVRIYKHSPPPLSLPISYLDPQRNAETANTMNSHNINRDIWTVVEHID